MDKFIELLDCIRDLVIECENVQEAGEVVELAIDKLKECIEEIG
jgi:hypothetical protein